MINESKELDGLKFSNSKRLWAHIRKLIYKKVRSSQGNELKYTIDLQGKLKYKL